MPKTVSAGRRPALWQRQGCHARAASSPMAHGGPGSRRALGYKRASGTYSRFPWCKAGSMRVSVVHLAAIAILVPLAARAQPAPAISDFATARPVIAEHGMVVSQEAVASRVGLDILRRGGNAVDAAVALGFALAVTLPRAGNIGGGGFMLIHRADRHETIAIDYREAAPALTTRDVFLDANGEADPFKSRYSGLAIGVPGTVAGLELAWRKYGSCKLSFADLVAPAAQLAHQGLTVDDDVADSHASRAEATRPASVGRADLSRARPQPARRRRSHRAR